MFCCGWEVVEDDEEELCWEGEDAGGHYGR